jgi:NAD(P)H-flavin reductase
METDLKSSGTVPVDALDPMVVRPFQIKHVIKELHDTFSLELEPRNGDGQFHFQPGQFNMLYVYGVGEVPISISGDPAKPKALIHTTREVGTVTRAMRRLKAGDSLGVRGPFGRPWPMHLAEEHDVVLITGGIGLAPLRPVIYYLLTHREKFGRVVLLYGARTPEDILYRKGLEKWRGRFDFETYLTVDRATGSWRGNVGVVTQLISRSPFDPLNCLALVCGPEIMMRFTVMELQKRGVADDRIFISMERNMKCGVGLCGHCQLGSSFVCKDGPVYCYAEMSDIFSRREL